MTNERQSSAQPPPVEGFDARGALDAELAAARRALRDDDPTVAVHQARVRLKRIRAIARLLTASQPEAAKALNAAARAVMAGLSQARDLAALEACARDRNLPTLAEALAARRAAMGKPPIDAARRQLTFLARTVRAIAPVESGDIERGVQRLARRARKACQAARGEREPEARHTWRKREKDRLHALDVLGAHWPKSIRRRRRTGKRLGRALGAERDVLLLLDALAHDAELAAIAGPDASDQLDRHRRFLADRADRLGRAVHRHGS